MIQQPGTINPQPGKALTQKQKQTQLNLQMREILGNAYGFIRGREYTKSFANITYEELLDAAIEKIGTANMPTGNRPSILERIAKIQNEIAAAVKTVKSQPPSSWVLASTDNNLTTDQLANPPPEAG